ncbi:alpha/beta hydrolase, partial [Olivibacter sp. XZL3]|uniref:alpha/beta hydrolase n=1 Tax=Olivibacter sp. XZL3 TaxID=1735116 RepID=UPI0019824E3C
MERKMEKVTFRNRDWKVAAHLHLPPNFDRSESYAAIVCVHPGSSVKEQTAGLYAAKLADSGFITLVFDASFQLLLRRSGYLGRQKGISDSLGRLTTAD